MYAPRFIVSMIGALLAFAIATYFMTHSLSTTLIQTVICAILIQIGYFVGVLLLAHREARARGNSTGGGNTRIAGLARKVDEPVALPVSPMNSSEPLNR